MGWLWTEIPKISIISVISIYFPSCQGLQVEMEQFTKLVFSVESAAPWWLKKKLRESRWDSSGAWDRLMNGWFWWGFHRNFTGFYEILWLLSHEFHGIWWYKRADEWRVIGLGAIFGTKKPKALRHLFLSERLAQKATGRAWLDGLDGRRGWSWRMVRCKQMRHPKYDLPIDSMGFNGI